MFYTSKNNNRNNYELLCTFFSQLLLFAGWGEQEHTATYIRFLLQQQEKSLMKMSSKVV